MEIIGIKTLAYSSAIKIPLVTSNVPPGLPSLADDYIEDVIDLNKHLVNQGVLNQLCHANFSTTEKSYFLLIFNPSLSGNKMSSCDMVKAQSGSGILHFLLDA